MEASGRLVGPPVFKTGEGSMRSLAGSIPVRLRFYSMHLHQGALSDTRCILYFLIAGSPVCCPIRTPATELWLRPTVGY